MLRSMLRIPLTLGVEVHSHSSVRYAIYERWSEMHIEFRDQDQNGANMSFRSHNSQHLKHASSIPLVIRPVSSQGRSHTPRPHQSTSDLAFDIGSPAKYAPSASTLHLLLITTKQLD